MSFVVSLEGFVPGPRYDGVAWTEAQLQYGGMNPATDGVTDLNLVVLTGVDEDPANPASRDFTAIATADTGYFRVKWLDPDGNEQLSAWVWYSPASSEAAGELVSELLDQVLSEAQFGIGQDKALRTFNQQHRKMVARSECYRRTVDLGLAVDGQTVFELDPDVIAVKVLTVDGDPWRPVGARTIGELQACYSRLRGHGGVFAQLPSVATIEQVALFPDPPVGAAVQLVASMRSPNLLLTERPLVPPEYHEALVDGTVGALLARVDERLADAASYTQAFDNACVELKRATRARFNPAVSTIQVAGLRGR